MLIESHFHQHWTVPDYANNCISPNHASRTSAAALPTVRKTVDFRQAAARSQAAAAVFYNAVNNIAWQLGFKDPAYFAAFLIA